MNSSDQISGNEKPYCSLVEQLDLTIRARIPLLYMIAVEEEPLEEVLQQVALRSQPQRQLLFWDSVRGWSDNGKLLRFASAETGAFGSPPAIPPREQDSQGPLTGWFTGIPKSAIMQAPL